MRLAFARRPVPCSTICTSSCQRPRGRGSGWPEMGTRVLLAGVSTRAAAESAARAGLAVTALDAFGDLDQHASVTACALSQRFTAHAAARAARNIQCDTVAYLSNFENHP